MSYTCLQYHIVFSTKDRRCFFDDGIMPRLVDYIGGIIRGLGGTLLGGNGPEDHIHLAAILPHTGTIADVLRDVKSNSSGWLRDVFPSLSGFGWQDGYSAFSVSQSVMPKVLEYIRNQKQHHKKMTYEEEIGRLLKQHGIDYDPRYV
jgi:REP element-mobilizing transposase RayT